VEGSRLADLFIVSAVSREARGDSPEGWRDSAAYPGLSLRFEKAAGRRCDRCWKVTPEADETGLCDRCRSVLRELGKPESMGASA
jgi:hypothetical protein